LSSYLPFSGIVLLLSSFSIGVFLDLQTLHDERWREEGRRETPVMILRARASIFFPTTNEVFASL